MDTLRDKIAIVGIGETQYVRKSQRNIQDLIMEAVTKALADAGIGPREVDGVISEGMVTPALMPHDDLGANLGCRRKFDATFAVVGPGNVGGSLLAAMAITSGQADVVLQYWGCNWGQSPGGPYAFHTFWPEKISFEQPYGFYAQPTYLAMRQRFYAQKYGLTERQLGAIAVTHRRHAILNGRAQLKKPMTIEDYLNSPMIADPLRRDDCCLISDGACAWVMVSAERAKRCPKPPVYVMGVGYDSDPFGLTSGMSQGESYTHYECATRATERALKMAGVSLKEVNFAEIYDCFTISLLEQFESIGFAKKGEGGAFFEEGKASVEGGVLPVNTHGGNLSHAYMLGAAHVVEAVRQLRGEAGPAQVRNAEIGLVGGYNFIDYSTLLLRR